MTVRVSCKCNVIAPPPDEWSVGYVFEDKALCIMKNGEEFARMPPKTTAELMEEIKRGRPHG